MTCAETEICFSLPNNVLLGRVHTTGLGLEPFRNRSGTVPEPFRNRSSRPCKNIVSPGCLDLVMPPSSSSPSPSSLLIYYVIFNTSPSSSSSSPSSSSSSSPLLIYYYYVIFNTSSSSSSSPSSSSLLIYYVIFNTLSRMLIKCLGVANMISSVGMCVAKIYCLRSRSN